MDYDKTKIAISYDKAHALAPETALLWQDLLSTHIDRIPISMVIDLGCGTGRFSELLAAQPGPSSEPRSKSVGYWRIDA